MTNGCLRTQPWHADTQGWRQQPWQAILVRAYWNPPRVQTWIFFFQYYLKPGRKKDKSQFTVRKIERGGNQFSKVLQKEMQCCLEQMMGCLCLKFFLFPVEFLAPKKGMCVRACMCACVCVCMCVCWGLWMAFRCYHAMPILRIFNHQHGMVIMAV